MKPIRIAVAGVGNCASSLLQGLAYYAKPPSNGHRPSGLLHARVDLHQRRSRSHPVARADQDPRDDSLDLRLHDRRLPRLDHPHELGGLLHGMLGERDRLHRCRGRAGGARVGAASAGRGEGRAQRRNAGVQRSVRRTGPRQEGGDVGVPAPRGWRPRASGCRRTRPDAAAAGRGCPARTGRGAVSRAASWAGRGSPRSRAAARASPGRSAGTNGTRSAPAARARRPRAAGPGDRACLPCRRPQARRRSPRSPLPDRLRRVRRPRRPRRARRGRRRSAALRGRAAAA